MLLPRQDNNTTQTTTTKGGDSHGGFLAEIIVCDHTTLTHRGAQSLTTAIGCQRGSWIRIHIHCRVHLPPISSKTECFAQIPTYSIPQRPLAEMETDSLLPDERSLQLESAGRRVSQSALQSPDHRTFHRRSGHRRDDRTRPSPQRSLRYDSPGILPLRPRK